MTIFADDIQPYLTLTPWVAILNATKDQDRWSIRLRQPALSRCRCQVCTAGETHLTPHLVLERPMRGGYAVDAQFLAPLEVYVAPGGREAFMRIAKRMKTAMDRYAQENG